MQGMILAAYSMGTCMPGEGAQMRPAGTRGALTLTPWCSVISGTFTRPGQAEGGWLVPLLLPLPLVLATATLWWRACKPPSKGVASAQVHTLHRHKKLLQLLSTRRQA
jgi:hypothetical protein